MEVSVSNLGKLKRKIEISLPKDIIKNAYNDFYKDMKSKVNVDGFRKGKFPQQLMEKRFKEHMSQQAYESLIPKYYEQALDQESLKAATSPKIEDVIIDKAKPFQFSAEFEIIPNFEIPEYNTFKIEKKDIVISDDDIEKQRKEFLSKASSYAPKEGDVVEDTNQVSLNYAGSIDDVPFDGGTANNHNYVVGSGQFLPEFDQNLPGMKVGEEKVFDVKFPEKYHSDILKGKTAQFKISINDIKEQKLPELNEEFFKSFGEEVNDEASFLAHAEKQVTETQENQVKIEYRENILEKIKGHFDFGVPEKILDQEVEAKIQNDMKANIDVSDDKKEEIKKEIADNIRSFYVLEKILEKEELKVDENEVKQLFFTQAYMAGANPGELIKSPAGEQLFQQIQAMVLKETVLDFLIKKVIA